MQTRYEPGGGEVSQYFQLVFFNRNAAYPSEGLTLYLAPTSWWCCGGVVAWSNSHAISCYSPVLRQLWASLVPLSLFKSRHRIVNFFHAGPVTHFLSFLHCNTHTAFRIPLSAQTNARSFSHIAHVNFVDSQPETFFLFLFSSRHQSLSSRLFLTSKTS